MSAMAGSVHARADRARGARGARAGEHQQRRQDEDRWNCRYVMRRRAAPPRMPARRPCGRRLGHHAVEHLRRQQHAGHAAAGVRAGADEVEAGHVLRHVVVAEVRRLREHRLRPERGAVDRAQVVLELVRRQQNATSRCCPRSARQQPLSSDSMMRSKYAARRSAPSRCPTGCSAPATARRTPRGPAAPAMRRCASARAGTARSRPPARGGGRCRRSRPR
jgi:hypothetical protein